MDKKPLKNTKFIKNGKITDLLKSALEDILKEYIPIVKFRAERLGRQDDDYTIREVYVIGSVLLGNNNSDLDLLLIANKIDQEDYRFIKGLLSEIFFNNLQKADAVDIFVRPYDEFPERNHYQITDQVEDLLKKYNSLITS